MNPPITPQTPEPPMSPGTEAATSPNMTPNAPPSPIPAAIPSAGKPRGSKTTMYIAIAIAVPVLIVTGLVVFLTISKLQSNTKRVSTQPPVVATKKATVATVQNKYANCLNKTNLAALQGDAYTLKDIEGVYHVYGHTFFFKPDSLNYEFPDQVSEELANYKKAFPGVANKDWTIELQGQIKDITGAGNTAANKKLANDRANKVKDEFIKVGVAASRITILAPEVYDSTQIAPSDSDRNVSVDIMSRCSDTQIEPDN